MEGGGDHILEWSCHVWGLISIVGLSAMITEELTAERHVPDNLLSTVFITRLASLSLRATLRQWTPHLTGAEAQHRIQAAEAGPRPVSLCLLSAHS